MECRYSSGRYIQRFYRRETDSGQRVYVYHSITAYYWPQFSLIEPKEVVEVNDKKQHFLYNRNGDGKERLCVFYPRGQEWKDNNWCLGLFGV